MMGGGNEQGDEMAAVISRRVTAQIDGDFVVFVIGMRINRPLRVHKWLPVFKAMPPMISELEADPESGFLGMQQFVGRRLSPTMMQFWRSFEHLERYARSHDNNHWPAWVEFNKRVGSSGDVGIWHETYLVPAGSYECIYNNMPPIGLGAVGTIVPAAGRRATAASRSGLREPDYPQEALTGRVEV
jgi:Domain of unknown function (DUF4188)